MFTKNKESIDVYHNMVIDVFEQIGRYGCFVLMVFNIPYTYYGFWFQNAYIYYIVVNSILLFLYLLFWIICWSKYKLLKAITLSAIPSLIFVYSGIMLAYYPLIVLSIVFAISHITISIKNAK